MSEDRLDLQALRAQLYDAMKDTQVWGTCDPSAEERLYIGYMQMVIRDWLSYVGRRISNLEPIDEDGHCDEYPSRFLQFYNKACEARGASVGKRLSCFAERLEASAAITEQRKGRKTPPPASVFTHSDTYQRIHFRGQDYDLTHHRRAAEVVRVMHQAHEKGLNCLSIKDIRTAIALKSGGNMYDWFRGTGLWKRLVVKVERGVYCLDLPGPKNS